MSLLESKGGSPATRVRRLTVLRTGALGDLVLTLPTVAALRSAFPGIPLRLIGRPAMACLVRPEQFLDADSACLVALYGPEPTGPEACGLFTPGDAVLAYIADAGQTVCRRLEPLVDGPLAVHDPRPPAGFTAHVTDYLALAVEGLGIPVPDRIPRVQLPPAQVEGGRAYWSGQGTAGPAVAIHPGSGGRRKCWPLSRFCELAERLLSRGARVLLLQGPVEQEQGQPLPPSLPCASPPTLTELGGLLAASDLFIGNDSGPGHLAAALGMPTLSLFGPTDPRLWRPRSPRARVLRAPGGRLSAVSVDSVEQDALRILEGS
ncbi:MAG: glycosyltransferase family 9 protein [Candidatus Latescibacterota bacterium]